MTFISRIECVTIPKAALVISEHTFQGIKKVISNNANFKADAHGVLIDLLSKRRLYVPPAITGNHKTPVCVVTIGEAAFADRQYLTGVFIPESVAEIGHRAFYHCTAWVNAVMRDGAAIESNSFEKTPCEKQILHDYHLFTE